MNHEEQYVVTFWDRSDEVRKRDAESGDKLSRQHRAIEIRRIARSVAVDKLIDVMHYPVQRFTGG